MDSFDLLVVGGGINGTAIARDASGRGLKVLLVERGDLAQHTSSASSKLIHGGLRYLEQYEFRLVREALGERAILLDTAPHIVRPLRFVLPQGEGMRPWWMIRTGVALYDLLAGRRLPRARGIRHSETGLLSPLTTPGRGLLYWDAWVDDARLVVLNALDAFERGAEIATRVGLRTATRDGEQWRAELTGGRTVSARAIVNAAGPWVAEVLGRRLNESAQSRVRLIKGSHIVVPALFEGDHAYILQQPDGRVVFAIAYEGRFTLIGTTDVPVREPDDAAISADEIDYLCAAANRYFHRRIAAADIVWSYAGVRSLYDSGEAEAKAVTRDYRLEFDTDPGPQLLSVFGGKITTARALAEEALATMGIGGPKWTRTARLPGGEPQDYSDREMLGRAERWMPEPLLARLARSYGTRMWKVIGDAGKMADLGRHFGAGLTEAEIGYLMEQEWARTADDVLWRRTKLGLHMSEGERGAVADFIGT